ncbi:hypothetical protein [Bacillus thuringiensis]|uniref:hypothetical protein n=1 Tax=Bacillus thuringiensis TaxID=1428 RepID=UPI001C3E5856|nr:hypothetical protein [Bacillus thuringiensis]
MILCAKSIRGDVVRVNFMSINIKHLDDGLSELSDLLGKFHPVIVDTNSIKVYELYQVS